MSSFIFLGLGGDIPFPLIDSELVYYHVLKTLSEEPLLRPGINEGVGLLFVQDLMKLMINGISLVWVEGLACLLN